MLEYLGYALFAVLIIGCLIYVMRALETEHTTLPQQPNAKALPATPAQTQATAAKVTPRLESAVQQIDLHPS